LGAVGPAALTALPRTHPTGGVSDTFVNNFKIIGEGSTQNFLETDVFHLTLNANGDVTAIVDRSTLRCV
jgi:hypothetical protein